MMRDSRPPDGPAARGVATVASPYGYAATLDRLRGAIRDGGLSLVCEIDHAAAASLVGLAMPPTTVLIFGNPRVGTPLMLDAPLLALDLPLRVLVHEDAGGQVRVSCDAPGYLADRFGIPRDRAGGVSGVAALVAGALSDHATAAT